MQHFPRRGHARVRSVPSGPYKAVARRFTEPIFANSDLDKTSVQLLKSQPLRLIRYVLRRVPVSSLSILGKLYPKDLRQIKPQHTSEPADDLDTEARWQVATFLAFSRRLNRWLVEKKFIEESYLLGNYTEAEDRLSSIEQTFGRSLWELDLKFLLAHARGELEANRRLLYTLNGNSSNWLKLIFLHHFSHKAQEEFSLDDYAAELRPLLETDPETKDRVRAIQSLIRFRLLPESRKFEDINTTLINLDEAHGIVDRFSFFCILLELTASHDFGNVPSWCKDSIRDLAPELQSPRIEFLYNLIFSSDSLRSEYADVLYKAIDQYTRGEYATCADFSRRLLLLNPTYLEGYELFAKCEAYIGITLERPFSQASPAWKILQNLTSVIKRDCNSRGACTTLSKLAFQLDAFSIGSQLSAFVRSQRHDTSPVHIDRRSAIAASIPTPRVYSALSTGTALVRVLSNLDKQYPNNAGVELALKDQSALDLGQVADYPTSIPMTRVSRHRAAVLEELGDYAAAQKEYRNLALSPSMCAAEHAEATAGLYRSLVSLGEVHQASRLVAAAVLEAPGSVADETILGLLRQYPKTADQNICREIGWPILFSVAQERHCYEKSTIQLHDVLDDFLSAHGLQQPTQLLSVHDQFSAAELKYLLKVVCVPSVLEESIWFENQTETEQERIRICEWLALNDSDNMIEYQDEISALNRAAAIREFTQTAERSRIYVDTFGIEERLPEATKDRAARCLAILGLREEKLRRSLEIAGLSLDDLEGSKVLFVDEGYRLFKSVFDDLRARFLYSNQFGLDANLSQRIRHGTIAGAIRAPFEMSHLVTQTGSDGKYKANEHWINRLAITDSNRARQVEDALRRLSERVDTIILDLRSNWIQIRGDVLNPQALFSFDFSPSELNAIYERCTPLDDKSILFNRIFSALWEKTQECLHRVRQFVDQDVSALLFKQIDQTATEIEAAIGYDSAASIRSAFALCRTQVALSLSGIAEWFRIDEQQHIPDCAFGTIVHALQGVVAASNREVAFEATPIEGHEIIVPGVCFRPLWDILLILFNNAIRHSGLRNVDVTLSLKVVSGRLELKVRSFIAATVDRTVLSGKVNAINNYAPADDEQEYSRREGGSGFPKIHKILGSEMDISSVRVWACVDGDEFVANIEGSVSWRR